MPFPDWEDVQDCYFSLLYSLHGGSGLSLSKADIDELDWEQVEFFIDRLDSQRSREAAALRSASRGK